MATHISQIILNKIEKEKIVPKSKWYFALEHAALWVPGVLVTALGTVAVSGILYAIAHSGSEYREFIYKSKLDFVIASLPFIWIISFIVFNSLIVKALRTTHLGYRLSAKKIVFGSLATSAVLGSLGYFLDEKFEVNSLIRYPVHIREEQVWSSPKDGRITGNIEKKYESFLAVRDKDNILWYVDMSGFSSTTFPFVEEGKSLRILGTTTDEYVDGENKDRTFIACAVFPWEIGGGMRRPQAPPFGFKPPKIRMQNKNPDCRIILEQMKGRMRVMGRH